MKTTINEQKQEKPFPKLMVSDGLIVFMLNRDGQGVQLNNPFDFCIGKKYDSERPEPCWDIELFKDFHGTITLEND